MRAWPILAVALSAAVIASCSTETTDPVFDNPLDPGSSLDIAAPEAVSVIVGNNEVRLSWQAPEGETPDRYLVLRRRLDVAVAEEMKEVARVTEPRYADLQVRNNRYYAYEIAAGVGTRFGKRTEEIQATPGLFSIALANDAPRTNQRNVQAGLSAPATVEAVQLAENAAFSGAAWRPFSSILTWSLSLGDGEKTVYARYRLNDGTESVTCFDVIALDTHALINAVSFDGSNERAPGDVVHFRVETGEAEGEATIEVPSFITATPLFDDGTNGDPVAGDGSYERDITLPGGTVTTGALVRGRFTDAAGNTATALEATRTLTVRKPPTPIALTEATASVPPDPARVTLRWEQTLDTDFAAYRVYRSDDALVDGSDLLVATTSSRGGTESADSDVAEGRTYFYRVFVRGSSGLETGSNTLQIAVPNVRPPSAVTLKSPDGIGVTRLALAWSGNEDLDFASYSVYRDIEGGVDDSAELVATITDRDRTYVDDTGLVENTEYHYRVYVLDTAGLRARSNEVSARTVNEDPPAVVLSPAASITSTAATLTWTASDAHDFKAYRLYRADNAAVSTGSTLVGEILEPQGTSFRDTVLDPATRYYYRVFVVDEGPDSKSTGSNVVTFETSVSN